MGILRKTKKKPEKKVAKKVRVEEFKFEPGKVIPIPPGTQLQWGRRTGQNQFYEFYKQLQEGYMPDFMPIPEGEEWGRSPWERGRNTRLDDSKYRFAMEVLSKKHRCIIEVEQNPMGSDYVIFHTRGIDPPRTLKISHTYLASIQGIDELINKVEEGLFPTTPGQKIDERITGKPKTPTDDWAEQWARKNK